MTQNSRSIKGGRMKFCIGTIAALALSVGVFPLAVAAPALAQSNSNNSAPVCMSRMADDRAILTIILPASDQGAMKAKGFNPVPCTESFGTVEQRESYRDAICSITAHWRLQLQRHFERTRGEQPAVLCGMAEMAIERWRRGGVR